ELQGVLQRQHWLAVANLAESRPAIFDASGRSGLDSVADQLLANVAFALDAPGAASIVEELRVEPVSQRACRVHHRIEALHRVSGTGQNHEEAHACKRLVEPLEIERSRLRQTGDAELRFAGTSVVIVVEDTVAAVLETFVTQRADGLGGKNLERPRNKAQRNDLLDLRSRLRRSLRGLLVARSFLVVLAVRFRRSRSFDGILPGREEHIIGDRLVVVRESGLAAPPPERTVESTASNDAPAPQVNTGHEHDAQCQQYPAQLGHRPGLYIAASCTASSRSTATSRETPGSCIVTPLSWCIVSIVVLLCVISTNCTWSDISFTMSLNRPTFASSKGASTSSSRQNGAGLSSKIEKTSATAVNAFSPPDSK